MRQDNKKDILILGISCFGNHDSSAVLMKNGVIIAGMEEERFTRVKFDRSFPENSINFCLKEANISIQDINYVTFFWKPWKGIFRRILYFIKGGFGNLSRNKKNSKIFFDMLFFKRTFRKKTGYKGKIFFLEHHITHASSAFFCSGLRNSAIISIDGTGEEDTCWIGEIKNNKIKKYASTKWPHSLGHVYSTLTQYLGFKIFSDEYKVMGLSSYGTPEFLELFRKIIKVNNGNFSIDLSYFRYQYNENIWYSKKWIEAFGPARIQNEEISQKYKNIASSLQKRLEEVIFELGHYATNKSESKNLCLTGGVALNSLSIGKLAESQIAEKIYTNFASGDAGCSIGGVYFIENIILDNNSTPLENPYIGKKYDDVFIEKIIKDNNLKFKRIDQTTMGAKLLSDGEIIGWFQGRSEFGQRALGNRSILADARNPETKNILNEKIKNREAFRPFAPAILEEYQDEYFHWDKKVPFMTEIHKIKDERIKEVPSVVHVDKTCRLQSVSKKQNEIFWNLINEFYKLTGTPIILNTSFNAKDEPIVESPEDAIKTFKKTDIKYLIMNNFLVEK